MTQHEQPAQRRPPAASDGQELPAPDERRAKTKPAARAVSPIVARQIDENLKRLYHQQVEQDLPPALQALVARLREGEPPPSRDDRDDGGAA